jgi:rhamnulokinase
LLGPPYHYRDIRTTGMIDYVDEAVTKAAVFHQTGIQFMPINTLFQLYSASRNNDPQLSPAHTFLMIPDLFHYWLTGRKAVEYTIASTSQMLDARTRQWSIDLLEKLGMPTRLLPEIVLPGTHLGDTLAEVNAEVGFQSPVPVITPGSHDTASAIAAVPGLDANQAYLSSGTWSLLGVELPEPVINDQALTINVTNEGGVGGTIRLLKNVMGLWLLQECKRRWEIEGTDYSWAQLLALAEEAEPFRSLIDPDRDLFLNPDDMPAAIRQFCRDTGQPEPENIGQMVRCCLESLALRYRWVLEALESLIGHRLEKICIVGGGSQNRMLSQFTADACGRPVITGPVEATALGNIMIQAVATGHLPSIQAGRQAIAASVEQETYTPGSIEPWHAAFARFKTLL